MKLFHNKFKFCQVPGIVDIAINRPVKTILVSYINVLILYMIIKVIFTGFLQLLKEFGDFTRMVVK